MIPMLALEQTLDATAPQRRITPPRMRLAPHFATLAVVIGLMTGTLVVAATLISL
jgi:hypothetical protein